MGQMSEREDESEVDEKLPSLAEGLASMTVGPIGSPAIAFSILWLGLGVSE